MKICKRCVNPETRPGMNLDSEGICPVCRFFEQERRKEVDWKAREKELQEIIEWGKANTRSSYDCIVTVSGGKDSMRQAFYARDELGLNVLLVSSVYPPEQLAERGAANLSNLVAHGFDTVTTSLNPIQWKKIMLQAFYKYANWCKSTEMALYAIPIHVAIAYKVPLVFLGENPLYTIGESEGGCEGGDASRMKYSNTLGGGVPTDLMADDTTLKDVHLYTYPSDIEMENGNLRIVYLGYYIRDWSGHKNAELAIKNGLVVRNEPPEETGDLWGFSGLDEDFRLMNQMIKQVKLGFGHVSEQVCEAITHGEMTREEGIELLKKYDGKCHPRYINAFCDYLGITQEKFWEVVEAFRDKNIWKKNANGKWELDYEF